MKGSISLRAGAIVGSAVLVACAAAVAWAGPPGPPGPPDGHGQHGTFHEVQAATYDPAKTSLAASGWISGIGCPTNAGTSSNGTHEPDGSFTDPACTTGDPKDKKNQGLLLAKTGPTSNFASGVANLKDVKGLTLTELGYDLRKVGGATSPNGSHCGAGAPRFDIDLHNGASYFLGCNSPSATSATQGQGWIRLRWGAAGTLMAYNASTGALENIAGQQVDAIQIVFDEGQDTGPDNFGLAVLDNIDVNGVLVGQGGPHPH